MSVCFDFEPPSSKGWSIKGAKFEEINGQARPVILFTRAKVESISTPTQKDLAVAIRLAKEKRRPEFVFMSIPESHPFAGEQYCCYSPQWMRGTNFGKMMYEGDLAMKQLTHNVRVEENGSYTLWEKTTKLRGLRTCFDFPSIPGKAPFYLSCNHVDVFRNKNSILFPNDPKMEIMLANSPDYWTYITSIYDSVAYYDALELEQVKELPKLILVAEWLIENNVPIDSDWLVKNTKREAAAYPTVRHMPGPRDNANAPTTRFSVSKIEADVTKAFLERSVQKTAQEDINMIRSSTDMPEKDSSDALDVNVKVNDFSINEQGHLRAEMTKSFSLKGNVIAKVSCEFRAAIDDDDFVCSELSPKMPLGINRDGSFICPDVDSWKELRSEVIFPFFGGIFVQDNDTEGCWEAQQQSWGGCSMRSFTAEPTKKCRPVSQGVPRGSGYMSYSNGTLGAVANLNGEVGCACVGESIQPASAKQSVFKPSRDVSASAPFAAHNRKLAKSGNSERVFGQLNSQTSTGYMKAERSGGGQIAKMSFMKTEKVLEGPTKGLVSHSYGAFGIPVGLQAGTVSDDVVVWGSDPCEANAASVTSESNRCSICLEAMTSNSVGILECDHAYHEKCIEKWFKKGKSTCPDCRRASTVRYVK